MSTQRDRRKSTLPSRHVHSRNPRSDHPSLSLEPCVGETQAVSRTGGRFSVHPSLRLDLGTIGAAASEIPPVTDHRFPVPNVDESTPPELPRHTTNSTAAYEDKPNWKSTLHASTGLVIDVVKESSDVFTPLKAVAGGLSAILKHYDV